MSFNKISFQYRNTDHILIALTCIITIAVIIGYMMGKVSLRSKESRFSPNESNSMRFDVEEDD